MLRVAALFCLSATFALVPPSARAQPDRTATASKPIPLNPKWSFTVAREKPDAWRTRYPAEFAGVRGKLAAFTLHFKGTATEYISFAIDYAAAPRSDVRAICAGQTVNPFKAARPNPQTRGSEFGRLGAFHTPDGRERAVIPGPEIVLTIFFDVPAACPSQEAVMILAFELAQKRHSFTFEPPKRAQ